MNIGNYLSKNFLLCQPERANEDLERINSLITLKGVQYYLEFEVGGISPSLKGVILIASFPDSTI